MLPRFDILEITVISSLENWHFQECKLTPQRRNRVSGSRVTGSLDQRFRPLRVESVVTVSNPVFDPVLSFNMRVYRGVVSTE